MIYVHADDAALCRTWPCCDLKFVCVVLFACAGRRGRRSPAARRVHEGGTLCALRVPESTLVELHTHAAAQQRMLCMYIYAVL